MQLHTLSVSEAIFGLLGVIVGGLITSGTSLVLERRKDRSNSRVARRLLCTDLFAVQAKINPIRRNGSFGPERDDLIVGSFERHADHLAHGLGRSDWKLVEGAVLGVRRLNAIRADVLAAGGQLTADDLADFERIGTHIDQVLVRMDD